MTVVESLGSPKCTVLSSVPRSSFAPGDTGTHRALQTPRRLWPEELPGNRGPERIPRDQTFTTG